MRQVQADRLVGSGDGERIESRQAIEIGGRGRRDARQAGFGLDQGDGVLGAVRRRRPRGGGSPASQVRRAVSAASGNAFSPSSTCGVQGWSAPGERFVLMRTRRNRRRRCASRWPGRRSRPGSRVPPPGVLRGNGRPGPG